MDIVSMIELMDKMEPGTVVHAEVRKDDTGDFSCEVKQVNGQKVEEA